MSKFVEPTKEELISLKAKYDNGNRDDQEEVVIKFWEYLQPYAKFFITRYYPTYVKNCFEDMMSCAKLGVLSAIKSYDPNKAKMTTWFSKSIRHEVEICIYDKFGMSQYYAQQYNFIKKWIEDKEKRGIPWTESDISTETGLPATTVHKTLEQFKANDEMVFLDAHENLGETIEDSINVNPEEQTIIENEKKCIKACLDHLEEEERKVIILKYGFTSNGEQSDVQIAKMTGIKKQDVKRIKNRAHRKIAKLLARNGMFENRMIKKEIEDLDSEIKIAAVYDTEKMLDELADADIEIDF